MILPQYRPGQYVPPDNWCSCGMIFRTEMPPAVRTALWFAHLVNGCEKLGNRLLQVQPVVVTMAMLDEIFGETLPKEWRN